MAKITLGGRRPTAARAGAVGGAGGAGGGGRVNLGVLPLFTQQQLQNQQSQQNQQNSNEDDYYSWAQNGDNAMALLQRQLGQTGNEAGPKRNGPADDASIYIQTSKAYIINNFLRSDGQKLDTYLGADKGGAHWLRPHSERLNGVYTGRTAPPLTKAKVVDYIRHIDKGMKPLGKDLKALRYENGVKLAQEFLGKDISIQRLMKMSDSELKTAFIGQTRENSTYSSVGWRIDKGSNWDKNFGRDKPVVIKYTLKKGTDVIKTNNITEHEILMGRGYVERVTDASFSHDAMGRAKLVLTVEVDPSKRKYKKY